jgi:hypothetical protein
MKNLLLVTMNEQRKGAERDYLYVESALPRAVARSPGGTVGRPCHNKGLLIVVIVRSQPLPHLAKICK